MKNIRFDGLVDDAYSRIVAAFCKTYNYGAKVPNAQGQMADETRTQEQFTLDKIMDYIDSVSTNVQIVGLTAAYNAKITPLVLAAAAQARAGIDAHVVDGVVDGQGDGS